MQPARFCYGGPDGTAGCLCNRSGCQAWNRAAHITSINSSPYTSQDSNTEGTAESGAGFRNPCSGSGLVRGGGGYHPIDSQCHYYATASREQEDSSGQQREGRGGQ